LGPEKATPNPTAGAAVPHDFRWTLRQSVSICAKPTPIWDGWRRGRARSDDPVIARDQMIGRIQKAPEPYANWTLMAEAYPNLEWLGMTWAKPFGIPIEGQGEGSGKEVQTGHIADRIDRADTWHCKGMAGCE
jgi:hypothetical protein